jgi:hypothetical protein
MIAQIKKQIPQISATRRGGFANYSGEKSPTEKQVAVLLGGRGKVKWSSCQDQSWIFF